MSGSDAYFLAGRSLGFWVIAGSLMLTNLSTEHLIGLNGDAFNHTFAVTAWETTAALAMVLTALYFLPQISQERLHHDSPVSGRPLRQPDADHRRRSLPRLLRSRHPARRAPLRRDGHGEPVRCFGNLRHHGAAGHLADRLGRGHSGFALRHLRWSEGRGHFRHRQRRGIPGRRSADPVPCPPPGGRGQRPLGISGGLYARSTRSSTLPATSPAPSCPLACSSPAWSSIRSSSGAPTSRSSSEPSEPGVWRRGRRASCWPPSSSCSAPSSSSSPASSPSTCSRASSPRTST